MRRCVSAGCVLFVMGCANESFTKNESAAADTAWTAEDTADTDADQEDAVEPVWWRLDAAVTVLAGAPEASTSRLSLTLISADGEALCEDTLGVTEILDVGTLPDAVIFAWWQVSAAEPGGDCAPWRSPVPDPLELGVGAMDPNIQANLSPAGLADLEDNLNASYASLDGGDTIYVFGVAGTDTAWLDVDEAADGGPVEDGTWIIKGIYPFSY